jgi:iron(II)-dependent oxidoreductase
MGQTMTIVEAGPVVIAEWMLEEQDQNTSHNARRCDDVVCFYLDRYAVTNRQFRGFLADGGYGQQALWDAGIWQRVAEFVDRTGMPGPRYWQNGNYPSGADELPVVGVSWYEADAFARWSGRRLPTEAEWLKAVSCASATPGSEPVQRRFPWGDAPDTRRANLWINGIGRPTPVTDYPQGASGTGARQMIGNVWEWTASDVHVTSYGRDVRFQVPLKSLRGGAFDTYFENQATCQLQSGDSPLARRHNIGFRCALSASDIMELMSQAP